MSKNVKFKVTTPSDSVTRVQELNAIVGGLSDRLKDLINDHTTFMYEDFETAPLLDLLATTDQLYRRALLMVLQSQCSIEQLERKSQHKHFEIVGMLRRIDDSLRAGSGLTDDLLSERKET